MSARDGDLRGLLVVSRFDVRVGVAAGYVTRLLDEAAKLQGCPKAIGIDNGPEFTGPAFLVWMRMNQIEHVLIQPGCPTQSAGICRLRASFNGSLRDECLSERWFTSLTDARVAIARWQRDYDEPQPHACATAPYELACGAPNYPHGGSSAGLRHTYPLIGRILCDEAHHALKLESDRNRHSLRAHVRDMLTTADAEEHPAPLGDVALWLRRFAGIFLGQN